MKRVLIFSVAYHPFIGGAEIAVREITDRLPEIEFHMLTVNLDGKQKKEEKVGNVYIYRLGSSKLSKFIFPITGFFKARTLHKKFSFTSLWSIMASQASIAASFFKIFRPHIPLILTVQEGDEESHLKRYLFGINILYKIFIRPWYQLVFKKADAITVISTYLKERAAAINSHVPIYILPNGVDLEVFSKHYEATELEKIRQEVGIKKDEKIIITTSRLVEKNGIADLIAALCYLPDSIRLCIIGVGDLEQQLRILAATLKIADRVTFLGKKPYEDIPKYLNVADVFVRPSLSEGMGNSFIEAMAAGIPIVGTAVGGIPDFLKDKKTGLFAKPHDPKSIAQCIAEILDNPDQTKRLVDQAHVSIGGTYEWKNIAQNMGKILVDTH